MKWFNKTEKYQIVEIEKPRTYSTLEGEELREALRSLNAHPGFRYLQERLRAQKSFLQGRLSGLRHKSMDEVTFLQQGMAWAGWLDAELSRLSETPAAPKLDPVEQELAAFMELSSLLETVG